MSLLQKSYKTMKKLFAFFEPHSVVVGSVAQVVHCNKCAQMLKQVESKIQLMVQSSNQWLRLSFSLVRVGRRLCLISPMLQLGLHLPDFFCNTHIFLLLLDTQNQIFYFSQVYQVLEQPRVCLHHLHNNLFPNCAPGEKLIL